MLLIATVGWANATRTDRTKTVAHRTGALGAKDLKRVVLDTTLKKAIRAHPPPDPPTARSLLDEPMEHRRDAKLSHPSVRRAGMAVADASANPS